MTAIVTGTSPAWSGSLDGAVALVTGGAGGLGAAICERLGAAGVCVVCADIRGEAAEAQAREASLRGRKTGAITLDLTDADSARQAVDAVVEQFGRLDILVNNAGIDLTAPATEIPVETWDRIMDVNVRAPFVLSRAAFEAMANTGGGAIVNIVSTAARRAWANASAYHASKWGLLGLSHALHVEGRPLNIKVTALIAGGMRTPFLLDRFPGIDAETLLDPAIVADAVAYAIEQPGAAVIPEMMVMSMRETSWP